MSAAQAARTRRTRPASMRETVARLEDLLNVGPSIAGDLRGIGVSHPGDLAGV